MIQTIFYFVMLVALICAINTISSKNPIHSILFLKVTFLCGAALMIILEAEYIAMTLIIVYVGAIIILFLFVIMMIDFGKICFNHPLQKLQLYAILVSIIFLGLFVYCSYQSKLNLEAASLLSDNEVNLFKNSVTYIGMKLYTKFILEFQITGLLLFLAMIGSITLVHQRSKTLAKKQNIRDQIITDRKNCIELLNVKSNSGVDI